MSPIVWNGALRCEHIMELFVKCAFLQTVNSGLKIGIDYFVTGFTVDEWNFYSMENYINVLIKSCCHNFNCCF